MNVAVHIQFKADRKEPLGEVIRRGAALFDRSGLQADVVASFSDGPAGIRNTSVVERALKKYPHLVRLSAMMRRCPIFRRQGTCFGRVSAHAVR
jgi:hypothetical protein